MTTPFETARYASLASRSVLVTGGAAGIGEATVRAFAAQGCRVAFIDIDEAGGRRLASETGALFQRCDLSDIPALRESIAAVADMLEGIDVLVNNAGRDDRHEMGDVEPAEWRRLLAFNLDHQFFATQATAPLMAAAGRGSVIMLGSVAWMAGMPGMVAYTTAKAAIEGLTRTLSRELGPAGIRVNAIVPGAVVTERQKALWRSPEADARFLDLQALKRSLIPADVARLALFLGSEESSGCTGANFVVDAGLTLN